jgi:predicted  nucleic acid-binding Zn-ribbon protein
VVAVRCLHCGARYDTELPVRAIERIRRCSRCGRATLVAVRADEEQREPVEAEADAQRHADERRPSAGGHSSLG